MKLIIYSVLAYSLLLSITCLVNSDLTNIQELKQQQVIPPYLIVQTTTEYSNSKISQQMPIDIASQSKYRYSTGVEDQEDDQDLNNLHQQKSYQMQQFEEYSPNLRKQPSYHSPHSPKHHPSQYILIQEQDGQESYIISLIVLFVGTKVAIGIYLIWRTIKRRRALNRSNLNGSNPSIQLQNNPEQLKKRIIYHQNQAQHLRKYFIQIQKYYQQRNIKRLNQFVDYDHPQRYYSQSSSRRSRSESVQSRSNRDIQIQPPQKRLQKYKFLHKISQGMNNVVNILTNQNMIIKTINKQDMNKINNYLNILRMLPVSSNIIRIIDIIQTIQKVYIVMEGGYQQLFNHIVDKRVLTQKQAIDILKQLISCVEQLNNHGISHSQICLELIYINSQKNIKLCPPTNSFLLNSSNKQVTANRRNLYCSPEMIQYFMSNKEIFYSPLLAEIWSCGIVFYQLLYHKSPFQEKGGDNTRDQLFFNIQNKPLDIDNKTSKGCKMLLLGMLAKNPQQRFGLDQIKAWIEFTQNTLNKPQQVMDDRRRRRLQYNKRRVLEREQSHPILRKSPNKIFQSIINLLIQKQVQFTITSQFNIFINKQELNISLRSSEGSRQSYIIVFSKKTHIGDFIKKYFEL